MDDVSKIIKEAIENTIGGNVYQHDKVNNWTGAVVENCLNVLTKLQKPYKYIGELKSAEVVEIDLILSNGFNQMCIWNDVKILFGSDVRW